MTLDVEQRSGGVVTATRDRVLDLIRALAVVRVVMWHTWSWAWLSWIPAMPAMFFTTGALLQGSLERRGWLATLRIRLRRLLIPYWVYAAACVVVMVLDGWRPTAAQAVSWVVPLWDPVGSDSMPGLWIPLWYVRAYLWFLLGAGLLSALRRTVGELSIVLAAAVGAAGWWAVEQGVDLPFAVGDALAYTPFVLAGMTYGATRRIASRSTLVALAVASAVAAVTVWQRVGPDDGVVNRSYLLTMLVGAAGLSAAFAFREPLLRWAGGAEGLVDRINRRALTIYLWQGFGLVAAQRLVDQRVDAPLPRALLSITVVAAVIVAAVRAVGWVEDVAAGRGGPVVGSPSSLRRRSLRWAAPGAALLIATAVLPPATAEVEAPLSGRAVVARAGLVEQSLASADDPVTGSTEPAGRSVDEVMSEWAAEHREFLDRIGFTRVELAIALPDGEVRHQMWPRGAAAGPPLMPWWSMTKVLTTAWLAQLAVDGVVALDDPLSRWLPEMPNADRMTLEQLARHTAGISASVESPAFEATPAGDLERYAADPQLDHEPGETFSYSRVGYFLLALALERASGEEWVDVVRGMGDRADVEIALDEPLDPSAPSTHPDGLDYRGALWSSGAVLTTVPDGVRLVRWLFTEELGVAEIELMADFSDDPDAWYYGLGLLPVCPCEPAGDGRLRADRYGLDSLTGSFNVDTEERTAVLIRPDSWWDGEEPGLPFFDLQRRLLDAVSSSG